MNSYVIILLCSIVVFIAYFITIFNNLISLKNSVKKNWSNIEVLLKQRNSELPKLIETCKQYMQYEQETLEKIVTARNSLITAQENNNMLALGSADSCLRANIGKLFALAENYPDLKTNQTFQQLQTRISEIEDNIADRREFYNESVNFNNIRIEQFPDLLIARMFDFKAFELLKFATEEMADVEISTLFKK